MYHNYNYGEMFTPEEILDYLRKSQSDDPLLTVEEVLKKHENILDDWDDKYLDGRVPEENRFREVVSGETIKERPEINKVLRLIESPKYKAVKVVEPQRLTRGDLEDIGRLMKLFKHTGTYVITPERVYDLRDEYDWNAFETELKRGNDYLNYYKKIQKRGRIASVAAGNYIFPVPPYGFDKTKVLDGKRECPTLKENPEQANIVRMVFDLYGNEGLGRQSICNYLDKLGAKPPKGKYWSPSNIREMLINVHYIGKVKWNWRPAVTVVEEGTFKKTRPYSTVEEYMIFEGRHEGIVSQEIWDKVQTRIGNNPRTPAKAKLVNPFAGLIFCKQCGRAITYRHDSRGKMTPRMMCPDQSRCGSGSATYDEIMEQVCDIMEDNIRNFEIRIERNEGDSVKLHARLVKDLEKKKKYLEAQELSQWEMQSHPDPAQRMPAEIFKKLNEKLLAEKEKVRQDLCKAYESMPEPVDYEEQLTQFRKAVNALRDPHAVATEQNRLLKQCIERIEFYKEKATRKAPANGSGTFPMTETTWTQPPIQLRVKLKTNPLEN